jgi:hypothetical protein
MPKDMRHTAWWQAKRRAAAKTLPVRCEVCGRWVRATDPWDLDHVRPVALGGMYGPTRILHRRCNREQGMALGEQRRRWTVAPSRVW